MDYFPFPDKVGALQELIQDFHFKNIPKEQIYAIVDDAWEAGVQAAKVILKRWPVENAETILWEQKVHVIEVDEDRLIGNMRYFSDYYSGKKEIYLYIKSIQQWADHHALSLTEAKEIIMFHELFHHLECHEPELVQIHATIPWIKVGKWSIGQQKLHAQSEIGAYGFSRTCYESKNLLRKEV